ncbi:MAG: hypothetical protein U5K69_13750 [Balneolaceae bacterium]|nr:hypothetical protein [Balneolaceae bacterium]
MSPTSTNWSIAGWIECEPYRGPAFDRYVGLAITAYNLHKIGRELRDRRRQARAAWRSLLAPTNRRCSSEGPGGNFRPGK